MAQQLQVNLSFTADSAKAKAQIQDLQNSLNNLMKNNPAGKANLPVTEQMLKAQQAAAQLSVSLKNATNVNTGKLNLTQFSSELQKSGMTLEKYRIQLSALGPEGEKTFLNLAKSVMTADSAIKNSNKLVNDLWISLKNTAKWQLSSSIVKGFMGAISTAFNYAEDLNKSLNQIQIVTGNSAEQMARFAKQANIAAKELSTTTTAYTDASLIYYQQGLDDASVKERTDITIKAANAAGTNAEEMADYLTAVWNSYKVGSGELERYVDVMAALGAGTATSLEEISTAMEKVASVGEATGVKFEQMSSIIATVSSVTRQSAETVGTAFKTIFARMADLKLEGSIEEDGVTTTFGTVSEQLAQVGVNILDANGNLKDMGDVMEALMGKWDSMNEATQQAVAIAVAGKRQYTQLLALMNNQEMYQEAMGMASGAEGTLQKQADTYAKSWEAAQKRVKAAAQGIYDSLINDDFFIGMNDAIADVLGMIEKLIDSMGGFSGVLGGLGALALKVFDKQINAGLQKTIQSIYSTSEIGKKQAEILRQQAFQSTQQVFSDRADRTETGSVGIYDQASLETQKQRLELEKQFIDNAKTMTEDEVLLAQKALDTNKAYEERALLQAKEREKYTNLYNENYADAKSQTVLTSDFGKEQESINRLNELLEIAKQNTSEISMSMKEAFSGIDVNTATFSQIENGIVDIGIVSDEVEAHVDELWESLIKIEKEGINTTKGQNDFKKLKQTIQDLIQGSNTMEKEFIKSANAIGINTKTAKDLIKNYSKMNESTDKAKKSMEDFKQASQNLNQGLQTNKTVSMVFVENLMSSFRAVSSLTIGLSSLKGAFQALSDPDMSTFDKVTSVLMSLSIGIPSVISGVKLLRESFVGVASGIQEAITAELGLLARQAQRSAQTVVDTTNIATNTAARKLNNIQTQQSYGYTALETIALQANVDATKLSTIESLKLLAAQKLGLIVVKEDGTFQAIDATAKGANTVATWLLKLAQDALNGSIGATLALLGIFIVAIGAAVAIIYGLVKAFQAIQNSTPEAKLAKITEEANKAQQVFEETTKRVKELKDTLLSIDESYKAIQQMEKGTEEWRDKIAETNISLSKLIDTYKDIDFLGTGQKGLPFSIDEDSGLIKIKQKDLENLYKYEQSVEKATELQANLLKQKQLDLQLDIKLNDIQQKSYEQNPNFIKSYTSSTDNKQQKNISPSPSRSSIPSQKENFEQIETKTSIAAAPIDKQQLSSIISFLSEQENYNSIFNKTAKEIAKQLNITENQALTVISLKEDFIDAASIEAQKRQQNLLGISKVLATTAEELGSVLNTEEKLGISFLDLVKNNKKDIKGMSKEEQEEIYNQYAKTYLGSNYEYKSGSGNNVKFIQKDEQDKEIKDSKIEKSSDSIAEAISLLETTQNLHDIIINTAQQQLLDTFSIYQDGFSKEASNITDLTEKTIISLSNSLNGFKDTLGSIGEETFVKLITQTQDLGYSYDEIAEKVSNIDWTNLDVQNITQGFQEGKYSAEEFIGKIEELNQLQILEGMSKDLEDIAEEFDLDSDSLKGYARNLMDVAEESDMVDDSLKKNAKAATDSAIQIEKMNKGIEDLADGFEDWESILRKSDKSSQEYSDAIQEMRSAVSNLLGVSEDYISRNFLEQNLDDLKLAAEGSAEAIDRLGQALAKDILKESIELNFNLSGDELNEKVNSLWQELQGQIDSLGSLQIGFDTSMDPEAYASFIASCNDIINQAGLTVEQANELFGAMGFTAVYASESQDNTVRVPVYEKHHERTNLQYSDDPAHPNELIGWTEKEYVTQEGVEEVPGDSIVGSLAINPNGGTGEITKPKIESLTYTGGGKANNYSSANKGGTTSPKKSSGGSGNKGGGSKSPQKSKKPQKTDVKDLDEAVTRYKDTDNLLESIERKLNKVQSKKDQVWGKKYIAAIDEENGLLNEQLSILDDQIKEAENYRNMDLSFLTSAGIEVELDENGFIKNFKQIEIAINEMEKEAAAAYDTAVNSAGEGADTSDAQELYETQKDNIEKIKNKLDSYEDAVNKYYDDTEKREETLQKIRENNYDKINHKFEVQMDLLDREEKQIEHLRKTFREGLFGLADNTDADNSLIGKNLKLLDKIEEKKKDLDEAFSTGAISESQYIEGMQAIDDEAGEVYDSIIDLSDAIGDRFIEALNEADEIMDKSISKFGHLRTIMNSVENLIKLTYGEEDFNALGDVYENIAYASEKELKYNREMFEERKKTMDEARRQYNEALAGNIPEGKTLDQLKENLEEAENSVREWQEKMYSSAEAFAEDIINVYQNRVNKAMKQFEADLTGGSTFDQMKKELEMLQATDTDYLTGVNQQYETQKMIRTATNALESASNKMAKEKLNLFIEETKELQKKDKLSEYELGLQQRKYEIALAEIALQEAQNNKSQVRLQKDSEGNFNYVYTADEDKVAEAQQQYEDAQNDLYNYAREKENEIQQARLENWEAYWNEVNELSLDQTLNEEDRAVKLAEIRSRYLQRDVELTEQSNLTKEYSDQSYRDSYTINIADQIATTNEAKVAQKQASAEIIDANEELKEKTHEYTDLMNQDYIKVKDNANNYAINVENDMARTGDALEIVQTQTAQWANAMTTLLDNVAGRYNNLSNACQNAMETISGFFADTDYSLMWQNAQSLDEARYAVSTRRFMVDNNIAGKGIYAQNEEGLNAYDIWNQSQMIASSSTPEEAIRHAYLRIAKVEDAPGIYENMESTLEVLKEKFQKEGWDESLFDHIKSEASRFDTGGYTGEFGPEGKFAMLHEKELVLNQQDTQNLLDTVDIVDKLLNSLEYQNLLYDFNISNIGNGINKNKDTLEQDVTIHAEFPNVQDHNEIEMALSNLVNTASQYANRKKS